MKKILFIILLLSSIAKAQNNEYILDPNGNKSTFQFLFKKYPNNSMEFRITKDSGKVFQITIPKYEAFYSNYDSIKKNLPIDTKKIQKDSLTYIIQFFYKDDTTFLDEKNNFTDKSGSFISFLKTMKRNVEKKHKNSKAFFVFEKGINISNLIKDKSFIIDENMILKTHFFTKSILCGSFLIIKPNGQSLIRNGEYRLDEMADHLKPEIWNKIFLTTNVNEKVEVKE